MITKRIKKLQPYFFIVIVIVLGASIYWFHLNVIPKRVFLSWKTTNLPPKMKENLEYNKRLNPDFSFEVYDDTMCRDFIQTNYGPRVVKAFDLLIPGAYKSDLWRYCILYKLGGVYMDIKMKILVKLNTLTNKGQPLFIKDTPSVTRFPDGGNIALFNAFFIVPPNYYPLKVCIDKIVENCKQRYYGRNPLDITGPFLFGDVLLQTKPSDYKRFTNYYLKITDSERVINSIKTEKSILDVEYPGYRDEQEGLAPGQHYSVLYYQRKVYADA